MISKGLALAFSALPLALGANWDVQVAPEGNLVYNPEWITANPGDTVTFTFNPKAHTVTQSSFDTPCVSSQQFDTGFVNVTAGGPPQTKVFNVPEGNTPLWFYCRQVGHCGQGMVFAINPPADPSPRSFSAFKALAIAQNGTASSSTGSAPASTFTTPPPPVWQTATATVTFNNSVYTTTYTSYDGTPPPTPTANPVDHRIQVGENGLTYTESNITASIGDTVTFEFHAKNHTVTQSSFLKPCIPLLESTGVQGFASGFKPVAPDATEFPTFTITINDTAPIWGYCGQTGHCAAGMVFSINAVESGPNNFEAFLNLAKQSNQTATSSDTGSSTSTSASTSSTSTDRPNSRGFISSQASLPLTLGMGILAIVSFIL
ncbi:putative GPI-anchored cupredoxin [Psilocybe cubensis]|uniref:Cupredoxin n=2 Tax=Psilocybe cubensis TaxID=181762 RepID=A0A8H8CGE1_PSICU|nr:putative GPI-anchored cupredoxin [Psilocybe cubensis]KAH9475538.1 putative GPI-anchored cupredoxin [Psilocybe cubensis]